VLDFGRLTDLDRIPPGLGLRGVAAGKDGDHHRDSEQDPRADHPEADVPQHPPISHAHLTPTAVKYRQSASNSQR